MDVHTAKMIQHSLYTDENLYASTFLKAKFEFWFGNEIMPSYYGVYFY